MNAALRAPGWLPLHAHQRRGTWLVWTGGRAAVGSTIESAIAALLVRYASGDA
ncbi:MAG: hypothetical protein IT374_26075 [Polyangiaceae bacterium]|nr:hypothetical protein [Polyangiaceae bacterium]